MHLTYLNGTAVVISWATGAGAIGNATTPTTPLAGWQTVNGPFSSIVQIGTKPGVYTNNATGYTTNCKRAAALQQPLACAVNSGRGTLLVTALLAAQEDPIWQAHACSLCCLAIKATKSMTGSCRSVTKCRVSLLDLKTLLACRHPDLHRLPAAQRHSQCIPAQLQLHQPPLQPCHCRWSGAWHHGVFLCTQQPQP